MPWWRREKQRSTSISDPVLAAFFAVGNFSYSGVTVSELSALGLSAVWRAISLISGTIASLPMRTLRTIGDRRERIPSWLDDPAGPPGRGRQTQFEWCEMVFVHLLLHGNAFLIHVYSGAGTIVGLYPVHPAAVTINVTKGYRTYTITLDDGTQRVYDDETLTHIPALTLDLSCDGGRGLSPIHIARNSLGTAIAGDRSAARMFKNGAMVSGLVTPEDDVTEEEARQIKEGLTAKISGADNAGDVAVINRKLKFTPWTMTAVDAQFLQSRQFSIEEVARWYGVPPHLLMQTEKQTSWGQGIEAQNRALGRTVLLPWARRVEQRLSPLLPRGQHVEFDFAGLERPSPEQEIDLLLKQVAGGLITVNEARHIRNLPPVQGGDELVSKAPAPPPAAPEQEGDDD